MARIGCLTLVALVAIPPGVAKFVAGPQIRRQLLQASSSTPSPAPFTLWYPGRPLGLCTSRGDTCLSFVTGPDRFVECPPRSPAPYESVDEECSDGARTWLGTLLKPFHVRENLCEAARVKTLRDRFGRPMTVRYAYKGETYVANREQVCQLSGHLLSPKASTKAANIDDFIWKNLSIWHKETEAIRLANIKADAYVECHKQIARFHCSAMFSNCTSEIRDKKPALPCKELCEDAASACILSGFNLLPLDLQCDKYPSKNDKWKGCSLVDVTGSYMDRVAGTDRTSSLCGGFTIVVAFCASFMSLGG